MQFHHAIRSHDYVLFNGGRGSGKTTAGAVQAIWECLLYQPGERGIIVAPTFPMLRDATMYEFFKWLPRAYVRDFNKTDKLLTLTNNSEVAFRSATDPDSLRGPNRAWAWLDEPRNLDNRDAFDVVSAQLRPTRKLWLTTTPSGIFHWLYELFIAQPLPNSAVVSVKTSENPYLPESYATGLRAQYTGAFAAQELDAEWVSFEGRIFDNFSLSENVSENADYIPGIPIEWGVDDGYALGQGEGSASYHPRIILLAQVTPQGGVNVFAEYGATQELSERSLENVLGWQYPPPETAYIDSSALEFKARIWDRNIQTHSSTHAVSEGIKNVRRLICDGNGVRLLQIHPRCAGLIRELQMYRYDPNSTIAAVGEAKPLKLDDHRIDSLRYLCWHLRWD